MSLDDLEYIAQSLHGLGHHRCSDPFNATSFNSALAKFWYINKLGPLTVYPPDHAHNSIKAHLLHNSARNWRPKGEELVFVLPQSNPRGSKKSPAAYGTAHAAAIVAGGGPFVLIESADMVERFLHKLGYMDGDLNSDLEEALFVFSQVTKNSTSLRKFGISSLCESTPRQVLANVRRALQSNDNGGCWQIPPTDTNVRRYFVKAGRLQCADAPRQDVHNALKAFSKEFNMPSRKTYHAYVWQVLEHLNKDNPLRRK